MARAHGTNNATYVAFFVLVERFNVARVGWPWVRPPKKRCGFCRKGWGLCVRRSGAAGMPVTAGRYPAWDSVPTENGSPQDGPPPGGWRATRPLPRQGMAWGVAQLHIEAQQAHPAFLPGKHLQLDDRLAPVQ